VYKARSVNATDDLAEELWVIVSHEQCMSINHSVIVGNPPYNCNHMLTNASTLSLKKSTIGGTKIPPKS